MTKTETGIEESGFDADFEIARITRFLSTFLSSAKANGFVIGISGGIDSAVVAYLCQRAVGSQNVTGLLMFENYHRNTKDYEDARSIIDSLKLELHEISITPIFEAFEQAIRPNFEPSRIALANIKARIRMTLLYSFANSESYLVAGTGDRSEDLIGYYTKYGDGGVDLLPIAHLYKGQVRELGRKLGIPESIVSKPSSPNLWEGHKATDEIPADYETLDKILAMLFDESEVPEKVSEKTGASLSVVNEVIMRNLRSKHKRTYPPMVVPY